MSSNIEHSNFYLIAILGLLRSFESSDYTTLPSILNVKNLLSVQEKFLKFKDRSLGTTFELF